MNHFTYTKGTFIFLTIYHILQGISSLYHKIMLLSYIIIRHSTIPRELRSTITTTNKINFTYREHPVDVTGVGVLEEE